MPASNIHSVDLNKKDGTVTIRGAFTDMANRKVTLLHVWLAQPGDGKNGGVGLAKDCLDKTVGEFKDNAFELTCYGDPDVAFREGPAIVSAIAVISPEDPSDSNAPLPEVIQWSRSLTLTLSEDEGKHVGLTTFQST
jgi:hypothetical protein